MSTTPPRPTDPLAPCRWWKGWYDFWFRPTDPTTLAFMRICTGLLVLYIHLAYSLDLQGFFGKHAWYAQVFIDRERHESPVFVPSFNTWEWKDPNPQQYPRLSDFPHRRAAFMEYLRALPQDKGERTAALAYLRRANDARNPDEFRPALLYVQRMTSRTERERHLTAFLGGKVEEPPVTPGGKPLDVTPSYAPPPAIEIMFGALPADEKARVAAEIRAFWDGFSRVKWSDPEKGRDYVFDYLRELPPDRRKALADYVLKLGDETEAEQQRLLAYMEYWNNDPRTTFRQGSAIFSVWFHVTDPTQMALVHTGVLLATVLFTIGLFTRVTSVIVWFAVINYIHRTQQVLFGMDTMMNILLFYLMIGNCGAALSVDRLIARYRAARASLARTGAIDANTRAFLACPPPSVWAGFGQRLVQVHFCFIYMAAGLSKLKGASWWEGHAVWDVLVNPEFTLMNYGWYESSMRLLAEAKPLYYTTTIVGAWFTLFVEIALPFLVWGRKLRGPIVLLAVVMHTMMAMMLGLYLFELLMIVLLLSYLPDRVVRDRFRGPPDLPRVGFAFNPKDDRQARAAALAVALDADNQVTLVPDAAATGTTVVSADGQTATGGPGTAALARDLRFVSAVRWVLWLPGLRGLLTHRLFPGQRAPGTVGTPATPVPR